MAETARVAVYLTNETAGQCGPCVNGLAAIANELKRVRVGRAGQSALDGIVRASNVLLAGHTVVVLGYGWAGQGVALATQPQSAADIVAELTSRL